MARQTYYVTRDQKHPLYKTRMLTAGKPLELDAGAAALYRKLGVDMSDEKPKAKAKAIPDLSDPLNIPAASEEMLVEAAKLAKRRRRKKSA